MCVEGVVLVFSLIFLSFFCCFSLFGLFYASQPTRKKIICCGKQQSSHHHDRTLSVFFGRLRFGMYYILVEVLRLNSWLFPSHFPCGSSLLPFHFAYIFFILCIFLIHLIKFLIYFGNNIFFSFL